MATLSTGGGEPHAIPVSTIVRADDATVVFVLARRRESLARLREDPRCALTILAAGVSVTAIGRAIEVDADVPGNVVAMRMDVERVQDHAQPTFEILEAVRWRWTDTDAERIDAALRDVLRRMS